MSICTILLQVLYNIYQIPLETVVEGLESVSSCLTCQIGEREAAAHFHFSIHKINVKIFCQIKLGWMNLVAR